MNALKTVAGVLIVLSMALPAPAQQDNLDWNGVQKVIKDYQDWDPFPDEPKLKRLGLPVHGHWVTTRVNKTALDYINSVSKDDEPLNFPRGSCIVKANYGANPNNPQQFRPLKMPGVLTVMYKNGDDFHQIKKQKPYNGKKGFLGGNWFFGFYPSAEIPHSAQLAKNVQANVASFCIVCHSPAFDTDYVRTLHSHLNPFSKETHVPYCDQLTQQSRVFAGLDNIPDEYKEIGPALDAYCNSVKLSSQLPSDVPYDPTLIFENFGSDAAQTMFDCFAWKTFIALNWPASKTERGEPDRNASFSGPRTGPTVWETFKPTYEVFQPDLPDWNPGKQEWNQPQPAIKCVNDDADTSGQLAITMSSKTRDVANETGQAFAGTFGYLVDRNGSKVRYEVLFNRTEFEYLIAENRATTSNLTPSGPAQHDGPVRFPNNRQDPRKVGSIEIKSSWKELAIATGEYQDAESLDVARKKFYVREVYVYDADSGHCSPRTMGLIGLHIAHKTYYAPQWVWMTFEHKDNVPPAGVFDQQATFFDPKKYPPTLDCWKFPFLSKQPGLENCPNVDLNRFEIQSTPNWNNQPNQVTRLIPLDGPANRTNSTFQKLAKGTPFENYMLISTQWPLRGRDSKGKINPINCANNDDDGKPGCFTMVPRYLRNTSMESFMTTYCEVEENGKSQVKQFSNRSCMGCHGNAGTDFSYIWLDAVTQRVPIKKPVIKVATQ